MSLLFYFLSNNYGRVVYVICYMLYVICHVYLYLYLYLYMCVCTCVYVYVL